MSLGRYLFVEYPTPLTIRHEYGHFKQSMMLGPLYLVLVGLWSIIRAGLNLYRNGQYYNGYPENWADKLGGVFINEQGRRDAVL